MKEKIAERKINAEKKMEKEKPETQAWSMLLRQPETPQDPMEFLECLCS